MFSRLSWILILLCVELLCVDSSHFGASVSAAEKRAEYWQSQGQATLRSALHLTKIEKVAKNVILFLGDGMGITTVTATRIYKGQKQNKSGEEELLTFDQFPFVSLSKTYGVDRQTSDSANTATAYLCGVKGNYGTLGLDGRVVMDDCETSLDKTTHVSSILKWAQDMGKWTGLVTSTRVTHATPAGLYAHSASRDWESDSPDPRCKDIASQLVNDEPGKNLRVILGGGVREFIPSFETDVDGVPGYRNDSRNLLKEWADDKKAMKLRAQSVFEAKDFQALNPEKVDYLLGLFHSDHLPYVVDRPEQKKMYPTLMEMTEKAIEILNRSPKGYFLLVEGGRIDMAHHMNWAMKALEEGVEFDQAIQTALDITDIQNTLIVVTADHSHTFTIGGEYPMRGNNILGLGGVSDIDNKTFTTLGYNNGLGYKKDSRDRNVTEAEVLHKEYRQDTTFPMKYETHGAEDVAVYARGPMAHLYHGVHEQSYIPYVMGYASCIGPNQDLCSGALSTMFSQHWTPFKFLAFGIWTYAFSAKMYF